MYTVPKESRIKLTFRSPAPPGYVTVKSRKIDAPEEALRDGRASVPDGVSVVTSVGEVRNIVPHEPTAGQNAYKQPLVLDDRMLAIILIYHHLGHRTSSSQRWSNKALGMLPRFHAHGKLNTHFGHLGRCAWVYVDGAPHMLLANSSYALVGNFPLDGPTATLRDDETLPLFSVSERPFPLGLLDDNRPLDQLIALSHAEYLQIFVEARSFRAVDKAKKRARVERALRQQRDDRKTADASYGFSRGMPVTYRVPENSPLQDLEDRLTAMQVNALRRSEKDRPSSKDRVSLCRSSSLLHYSGSQRSRGSGSVSSPLTGSAASLARGRSSSLHGAHRPQHSYSSQASSHRDRRRGISSSQSSFRQRSRQGSPSQLWSEMNGGWYQH